MKRLASGLGRATAKTPAPWSPIGPSLSLRHRLGWMRRVVGSPSSFSRLAARYLPQIPASREALVLGRRYVCQAFRQNGRFVV